MTISKLNNTEQQWLIRNGSLNFIPPIFSTGAASAVFRAMGRAASGRCRAGGAAGAASADGAEDVGDCDGRRLWRRS